jgi:geranylgeranyl pyrophosphate synthase
MRMSCAELLSDDAPCNSTMKVQINHTKSLIHNDVQMVRSNLRKEEFSAYDYWNNKKKKKGVC